MTDTDRDAVERLTDDELLAQINAFDPYDVEFVRRYRALLAAKEGAEAEAASAWNTRADHALVAEAYEVARKFIYYDSAGTGFDEDGFDLAIPADAEAAREARDKQVRDALIEEINQRAQNYYTQGQAQSAVQAFASALLAWNEDGDFSLIEKDKTNE